MRRILSTQAAALLLTVLLAAAPAACGAGARAAAASDSSVYLVGIGKGDITGPVAEINPMGYSMPDQIAMGLHTRLYARTFIFAEPSNPT